jgi:hypothetical protein
MFPIDAFRNTLAKAVAIFERHAIRFHLTGGLTSVLYGEPRMTQDIDIVADNRALSKNLDAFLKAVAESDFLFDASTVRNAVEHQSLFLLCDQSEVLKLDIYPRELIPDELNRSQQIEVFEGWLLPVVSRADVAASKLLWISKGIHKSRRDVRQFYRMADDAGRFDIRQLAAELELETLLDEVLNEPDEIEP